MNEKLMSALCDLFIEDSPIYKDVKGLMELAIKEERERCRRIANHYEKGGAEQAALAGKIRQQIEEGS